jgi:hypothetical protein
MDNKSTGRAIGTIETRGKIVAKKVGTYLWRAYIFGEPDKYVERQSMTEAVGTLTWIYPNELLIPMPDDEDADRFG